MTTHISSPKVYCFINDGNVSAFWSKYAFGGDSFGYFSTKTVYFGTYMCDGRFWKSWTYHAENPIASSWIMDNQYGDSGISSFGVAAIAGRGGVGPMTTHFSSQKVDY